MAQAARKQDPAKERLTLAAQRAETARQIAIAERLLKIDEAKNGLIPFTELTMPDPADPDNPHASRYTAQYFHRALAHALEEVERGNILRLIITFPPRHGKSELANKRFIPWLMGRDPYKSVILGTYNQPFADSWGKKVREIIRSPSYRQIFPTATLAKGGGAADELTFEEGGQVKFVGRGGSATGRGADVIIIDDALKDRAEANSDAVRAELWEWFNDTISTRLMSDTGAIIIIMTRWHEDDLVGRLTDPENPHYREEEARQWKIINIPALAEEDDVLGRQPGEALWEEKFGREYLESFRRRNPKGFAALYQQRPTPEDGDLFTKDMLITYQRREMPQRLRIYAASDHAIKIKQENDFTVLLVVGVDEYGVIWLLDCLWFKKKSDAAVEDMLALMKRWKPLIWWAEKDHITGSIGPFLRRRMRETGTYINIAELTSRADKVQKAQPIIGRAGMGMVRFPADAPWLEKAKSQLLKFPQAAHDDFVDALANIGRGLDVLAHPTQEQPKEAQLPRIGTLAWVKFDARYRGRDARRQAALRDM